MKPSSKVIVSTVVAFLAAVLLVLQDDGVPSDLKGWLVVIGKVLGGSGAVGAAGYLKTENRPSPSAIRAALTQR